MNDIIDKFEIDFIVRCLRKVYNVGGWAEIFNLIAPNTLEKESYTVFSIKNLEYCLNCHFEHDRYRKSVVIGTTFLIDTLDIGLAGYCKECFREKENIDIKRAHKQFDNDTLKALFSDDEIDFYKNTIKN